MLWFVIALIGYFLLAVVFIMDKYILTESLDRPEVYTFYSTIFLFGALLLFPFGVSMLAGIDWLWATVSGVAFGLGLWTNFIALRFGETSHISPFIGGFVTIGTFVFAASFLGEQLTEYQQVGIGILLFASLLLSFEKSLRYNGFHVGFAWAGLSGLLYAVSHVSTKYIYDIYGFITGLTWTRATTGLIGVLMVVLYPSVREIFKKKKKPHNASVTIGKKYAPVIVITDKAIGVIAIVCIQFAIAIGSASLVTALSGVQFAMMFLMVFLMTTFAPKIFKELFTKRELVFQTLAIVLVVLGSALFVL